LNILHISEIFRKLKIMFLTFHITLRYNGNIFSLTFKMVHSKVHVVYKCMKKKVS
jgi:hypothetical protein